jgi:hypothetical protein
LLPYLRCACEWRAESSASSTVGPKRVQQRFAPAPRPLGPSSAALRLCLSLRVQCDASKFLPIIMRCQYYCLE